MKKEIQYLSWAVLFTLAIAIARQLSEQKNIYLFPDSFGSIFSKKGWDQGYLEGFNGSQEVKGNLDIPGLMSPADATLETPRQPYNLLNGVLAEKGDKGSLTAQTCYQKDFIAQSDKTGNYIQRTNNFRHAAPDSCSAPFTEMVNSFYLNP